MVSLRKGVLKIEFDTDNRAKNFYEFTFLLNMVVVFAFYEVKLVAPIAAIIMFVASLILVMKKNKNRITVPYITVWYFILILYGSLSALWAQFFSTYTFNFITRLIIILLISTSVSIYVDNMDDLNRIMNLFVAGALIIALLEFTAVPSDGWQSGRVGSYFSNNNPNDITIWMDFATIIAFYQAYVNGKKSMYLPVLIFVTFCVFSGSRKGLLAAVCGPMMIVLLFVKKNAYVLRIIAAIVLVLGIAVLVMENDTLYSAIGQRFDTMFDFLTGEGNDGSMSIRQFYISVAKEMFNESPIIGKGMGNFALYLNNRYSLGLFYSHNNYWQLLSELGLVGLFIYYSMYVYCFVVFLRYYFVEKRKVSVLFITAITMMAVLDSGIISYSSKYGQLVIAVICCATYAIKTDGGRKYNMNRQ